MTPKEFWQQIATLETKEVITLAPTPAGEPLTMLACAADAWAARLMLWLIEQLPPETTQGELEDILDMTKWWAQF
jgi:hypothetical protein